MFSVIPEVARFGQHTQECLPAAEKTDRKVLAETCVMHCHKAVMTAAMNPVIDKAL